MLKACSVLGRANCSTTRCSSTCATWASWLTRVQVRRFTLARWSSTSGHILRTASVVSTPPGPPVGTAPTGSGRGGDHGAGAGGVVVLATSLRGGSRDGLRGSGVGSRLPGRGLRSGRRHVPRRRGLLDRGLGRSLLDRGLGRGLRRGRLLAPAGHQLADLLGAPGRLGAAVGGTRRGGGTGRHLTGGWGLSRDGEAPLHPVEARGEAALAVVSRGQQHPGAQQLQVQARRGRPRHLRGRRVGEVGGPRELCGAEARRLQRHPLQLVGRHAGEDLVGLLPHRLDDHEVPQALQQVVDEAPRVLPGGDHPVDHAEDRRAVAGGERRGHVVQQGGVGVAEEGDGVLVVDALRPGAGGQLVEDGQRVTHRPGPGAHHQRKHPGADDHALRVAHLLQVALQDLRRHQPERVVVGARADGAEHLVGLRGGEDEGDVRRRLLDDLQQGVEALRGDHVRLVDDEDLLAVSRRGERGPLPQLPRVVDAAVAGRVDLDDVEAARSAAGELHAAVADPARRVASAPGRSSGSARGCGPRSSCRSRAARRRGRPGPTLPVRSAARSGSVTCSCPMTSAKVSGR